MKKEMIVALSMTAAMLIGMVGCSSPNDDAANGSQGADSAASDRALAGGEVEAPGKVPTPQEALPEFAFPTSIVLSDAGTGLNCSYAAPGGNFTMGGFYKMTNRAEEYYAVYGYRAQSDLGKGTLKDEEVFAACLDTILDSAAFIQGSSGLAADEANVSSMDAVDVNGWPMVKVAGTFEQASGGDAVSSNFVAYTVVNGDAVTWFYVADNTSDKTTPASDLEDLAKRIAQTYRNED